MFCFQKFILTQIISITYVSINFWKQKISWKGYITVYCEWQVYCDSVLYVLVLMFQVQSSIELLYAINHFFIFIWIKWKNVLLFAKTYVAVEQSTILLTMEHQLQTIQTVTKNTSLWKLSVHHHCLVIFALNTLTYLLTYLYQDCIHYSNYLTPQMDSSN